MDNLSKEARIKIRIVWTVCGILVALTVFIFAKNGRKEDSYYNASRYSSRTSSSSSGSYASSHYGTKASVSASGLNDVHLYGVYATGDAYRPTNTFPYTHYKNLGAHGYIQNLGSRDITDITVTITVAPYVYNKTCKIRKWVKAGQSASISFTDALGIGVGKEPISSVSVKITDYTTK